MVADLDPVMFNRAAWDLQVEAGSEWTVPVPPDVINRARMGDWSVVLIDHVAVDRSWFPLNMTGVRVLALASGGGQQGPVLAAAGAKATVFDNSPRQLRQDDEVAEREGLSLHTVLGDMQDLSAFADASFEVIVNPVSNSFVPRLAPVWEECFRVLQPGGVLLVGFANPDTYVFDAASLDARGDLVARHALPYADLTHLTKEERAHAFGPDAPLEYSHSMADQLGGQTEAGFMITGFVEASDRSDPTSRYLPGFFCTRAVKPG